MRSFGAAGAVEQIVAAAQGAGIDAEEREFAHALLIHRLENVETGSGFDSATVVSAPLESLAGTSARSSGEEPYLAMKSIRRATPTLVSGRGRKERDEDLVLNRLVQTGAQFFLRQHAFCEEFLP